jgi:adenylate cyclase
LIPIGLSMAKEHLSDKLAVILHADVAGSTALVQQDEHLAHERIQESFQRFSDVIEKYRGRVLEIRGDALLGEFERASDAVTATLAFQADQAYYLSRLKDDLQPVIRVGIAMGEIVMGNNTVTGAGVILAQRVEQLADPGGVCVTAALHEALPKRMPFDLENLGEQVLKGFDDPVRVYRVELSAGKSIPAPQQYSKNKTTQSKSRLIVATIVIALVVAGGTAYWFKAQEPKLEVASVERMAFPLPDKPSIAVLPFANMSNNAEQEYFVDGMTEDLITDISKVSGLFVIARNSVFTFKGKSVKVRQVAEELGVRYVVEGSVQRVGNQVRINAQLIDATTGGHIWAERYDGSLDDVFTMRDEITRKIVDALAVNLVGQEQSNLAQVETVSTKAHDLFLKGWGHYRAGTEKDYAAAVNFFEKALAEDPDYNRAQAALAAVYWNILRQGHYQESLGVDYYPASERARVALRASQKNPTVLTHQITSESIAFNSSSPRRALAEAETALTLDPNDPAGHLAMGNALLKAKKPKEAERSIRTAMRLDPHYPASYLVRLAQAQFHLEDYQAAAESLENALTRIPDDDWALVYLAATYGQLGLSDKGRASLKQANKLRAESGWGPITLLMTSEKYFRWQGKRKTLKDGLRTVGAPPGGEYYKLVSGDQGNWIVDGVDNIDVKAAKILHERGAVFVDVFNTWYDRRIPGAYLLEFWRDAPESYLFNEASLGKLAAKDQEIVIYSSSARNNGALASAFAMSRGFEKIYYLRGGLDAWIRAGYQVEKGKL